MAKPPARGCSEVRRTEGDKGYHRGGRMQLVHVDLTVEVPAYPSNTNTQAPTHSRWSDTSIVHPAWAGFGQEPPSTGSAVTGVNGAGGPMQIKSRL